MKNLMILIIVLGFSIGCTYGQSSNNSAIVTGVNPDSWVTVPSGEFFSGMHEKVTDIDYDYEIMITHVTNQQYVNYLNYALIEKTIKIVNNEVVGFYPGDKFDAYLHEEEVLPGDKLHMVIHEEGGQIILDNNVFSVADEFKNHPVVLITWFGAKAYADFYGYRLPTELEWEKAARGVDTRPYPWGDEISFTITNYASSKNALQRIMGDNATTTPVGYYNGNTYGDEKTENNISYYGLYDMGGNAWQWVGDDYPNVHYRYMKGGSFTNYEYNLFVWARNSAGPDFKSIYIGFRCARDVKVEAPVELEENTSEDINKVAE